MEGLLHNAAKLLVSGFPIKPKYLITEDWRASADRTVVIMSFCPHHLISKAKLTVNKYGTVQELRSSHINSIKILVLDWSGL